MEMPPYFEQAAGHAVLRLRGRMKQTEAADCVTHALAYARETGVRRRLVVLTEMEKLLSPTLTARYEIVREWARESGGPVRVSVAMPAELIDPGRFGVMVAANAGMTANVFEDEQEAWEWLLQ